MTALERLNAVLGAEVLALGSFVQLLRREHALLRGGATEALLSVAEEKSLAGDELQNLGRARNRELAQLGLPMHARGIEQLASHPDVPDGLAQICLRTTELAREASELNRRNGLLVSQRLGAHRQAFDVLRAAGDAHGALYGPDGQADHASLKHHLASG